MDKLLACYEMENKDMHFKDCHNQGRHFSLFVLSLYDILSNKALVVLSNLSQLMAKNLRNPFPTYGDESTNGSQSR